MHSLLNVMSLTIISILIKRETNLLRQESSESAFNRRSTDVFIHRLLSCTSSDLHSQDRIYHVHRPHIAFWFQFSADSVFSKMVAIWKGTNRCFRDHYIQQKIFIYRIFYAHLKYIYLSDHFKTQGLLRVKDLIRLASCYYLVRPFDTNRQAAFKIT